jgi:Flp pilus assembly protein TadB
MYVIPLIVLILLGLVAVAWSPIFALIFFAIFMVGFFAFIGMRPRADQQLDHRQELPNQGPPHEDGEDTGLWGERRPS